MASAADSRLAYARPSAVATASRLPTANRGSNNSYTTSWDTTIAADNVVFVSQSGGPGRVRRKGTSKNSSFSGVVDLESG